MEKLVLIHDMNKNEVREGDVFTFSYSSQYQPERITLVGTFVWNQDELRYEVDILHNSDYVCLSYNTQTMSRFELIENN